MPEYLAPGVYVEEVSYRAKSLEGVSTSVAGFIGPTRYGPIEGEPELLTSFADFERIYGGLDRLVFEDEGGEEKENYMAHAVRACFDNGCRRLYVSRVYRPPTPDNPTLPADPNAGRAALVVDSNLTLRARFPGRAGGMIVEVRLNPSSNVLTRDANGHPVVRRVRPNDVIMVRDRLTPPSASGERYRLYDVTLQEQDLVFMNTTASPLSVDELDPDSQEAYLLTLSVLVLKPGRFETEQVWDDLSPHPDHRNSVFNLFTERPESRTRYLIIPFAFETSIGSGAQFVALLFGEQVLDQLELSLMSGAEFAALNDLESPPGSLTRPRPVDLQRRFLLSGGSDGNLPNLDAYRGREAQRDPLDPDIFIESSGLESFANVEEISMVAAPAYAHRSPALNEADNNQVWSSIAQALIIHCQIRMRYRVALLDAPNDMAISEVRAFRGQFDSTHAALYYPWVTILDPVLCI